LNAPDIMALGHETMRATERVTEQAHWPAQLTLGFTRRDAATVLTRREHVGPLRIQKALYPEGPELCHAIVLHPPSGIAGGDQLRLNVDIGAGAQALLTTPGAGKWYRSSGAPASMAVSVQVSAGSTAEWLPQESIVFSGANARMHTHIELADGARYIGLETLCFGRRASGETFERGQLRLATDIRLEGRPLWRERGVIDGGSAILDSPIGLAGLSLCSTVLAAGLRIDAELLTRARLLTPVEPGAQCGVTALPWLLVGRYLGHSSEAARQWFEQLWAIVRPAFIGREAQTPRIWAT
jgi:urease accessory protein